MSVGNTETGELVETMTRAEAEDFVRFMRAAQEQLPRRVIDAYHRRAWIPLGYASWEVMIAAEGLAIRLPRGERKELVMTYTAAGLSTRAIAPALGASQRTVANDVAEATEVQLSNSAQSLTPTPVVRTTTGLDGRERTSVTAGHVQRPPADNPSRDTTLVNDIRLYLRTMSTSKEVRALGPVARDHIITALADAATHIQEIR